MPRPQSLRASVAGGSSSPTVRTRSLQLRRLWPNRVWNSHVSGLPESHKSTIFQTLKTTLDIPNDLYRQAKAQAALENRKVKDLVAQGLRLVLSGSGGVKPQTPMEVLEEIRRNPLHPPGKVSKIMKEMKSLRKKGWSRGDLRP